MGVAKHTGRRRQHVCEVLEGILTDSNSVPWSTATAYTPTQTFTCLRVYTCAGGDGQEKTKGLSLLWNRPRGCADNCRKYGRRVCVAKVICRVIMGAGNSSSSCGTVRICCLLHFEEYPVEWQSNTCNNPWDQNTESYNCFPNLDPVTQVLINFLRQINYRENRRDICFMKLRIPNISS